MPSAEEDADSVYWWIPIAIGFFFFVIALIVWLLRNCRWICQTLRGNLEPRAISTETIYESTETRPSSVIPRRVKGLRNLTNTCYFGAAIQCLCQTTLLRRKLDDASNAGTLIEKFINLLNEISHESNWPLNPTGLHVEFCSRIPKFRGNKQEDSHEFLRNFLNELRKDQLSDNERENIAFQPSIGRTMTAVDQIFGGHNITVYICNRCSAPYHICEPILDASLPVRFGEAELLTETASDSLNCDDSYRQAVKLMMTPLSEANLQPSPGPIPIETMQAVRQQTISDSLRYFTRVEHIENEYYCTDCNRKRDENGYQGRVLTSATKRTLILNPPAVLTIHLKRFELMPGHSTKVNDLVKFDELLDIGPYCSSWCMRNDPPTQNLWYSLYGVVVHQSGFLTSGHYIAYVKVREEQEGFEKFLQKQYFDHRNITAEQLVEVMEKVPNRPTAHWQPLSTKGVWYLVNDSYVCEVTSKTVLQQEAYLLFYERLVGV